LRPFLIRLGVRFVAMQLIWVCSFQSHLHPIRVGWMVGLVSEKLDGTVDRRPHQTSVFGGQFGSFTVKLLLISGLVWPLMLLPETFSENTLGSLLPIFPCICSLIVGLVRFKRMTRLGLNLSSFGGLFLPPLPTVPKAVTG
jgi:hypothetical protein